MTKKPPVKTTPPTLDLFAGSIGAGKTTFARGLSPLDPQQLAVKAGKLLLRETMTASNPASHSDLKAP